jgi:hypothetical protein
MLTKRRLVKRVAFLYFFVFSKIAESVKINVSDRFSVRFASKNQLFYKGEL